MLTGLKQNYKIKYKYDGWRNNNEPLIEEFLRTIQEEISIRVAKAVQDVQFAVTKFTDMRLSTQMHKQNQSQVDTILSDDSKFGLSSTGAVVTSMIVIHFVAAAFAPIAFLLYPLFNNYRKKWQQHQREQLKPQIVASLHEGFSSFRKEIIKNINYQKDLIDKQIDQALTAQNEQINKQIDEIEKERQEQKTTIEQKISEYNAAVVSIGEI